MARSTCMIVAWRSGLVALEAKKPEGAIGLFRFRDTNAAFAAAGILVALARHARQGPELLVPGVPEAENDDAALDALIAFRDRLHERFKAQLPPRSYVRLRKSA